jgi:uncharacterized protein (DUF362 family)
MALSTSSLEPSFQRPPATVAIRRAASYDADLAGLLDETLREFNLPVRGKTVLLKPNFVGPDPLGIVNTHPAVVAAARESFLRLGASNVVIGEGPALERDTESILEAMRLREYVGPLRDAFVDLNSDDVHAVKLRTRASSLKRLYLPRTVVGADFIVSMPKMKTHHWAGVTLSLKNMFGVVPGSCYGWPKNILHWAGISRAVLDINSTVRPDFAIVDGIVGMEGDGPTQGSAKPCAVLVLGNDPVAVDATCARIMGLAPERIDYLKKAAVLLGHITEAKIKQIGESVAAVRSPFSLIESFRHLQGNGHA